MGAGGERNRSRAGTGWSLDMSIWNVSGNLAWSRQARSAKLEARDSEFIAYEARVPATAGA